MGKRLYKPLRKPDDFSMILPPLSMTAAGSVLSGKIFTSPADAIPASQYFEAFPGLQTSREPLVDKIPSIRPSIAIASLKARAKANAGLLATKLKSAVTFEALRQIRQGIADKAAITAVLGDLSDKELRQTAQASITEAFGFGRSSEAAKYSDELARVQYSAILDDNTCGICEPLDGEEWDFEDLRTDKYARGNPECEGKTRCRCLLVYISKSERRGR